MNSKLSKWIVGLMAAGALSANATISVNWGFGWGMYESTAVDLGGGSGGVAENSAVLWQLIYSPDAAADIVDASGNPTAGESILATRTTSLGGSGGFDAFLYDGGSFGSTYTAAFTAGYVYIRVFQDTTPTAGDKYYNSPTLQLVDITPPATPQILDGNTDSATQGDKLNLTIVPEPGTFAFLGIGGLLLAVRRMRRS